MPECGSQITICDLPIRFDTYKGCSHLCQYCFVQRKADLCDIDKGETPQQLLNFIKGKRNNQTNWCDWNIPIHWGGMSDPFQPVERKHRLSYECLKVFKETQYPFVVSTKGKLICEDEYLELIKDCNCVIQISLACPEYDKIELGTPKFEERLKMVETLAKYRRVNIRIQPYMVEVHDSIKESVERFAKAGAYGIIVEAMKFVKKKKGLVKVGGDWCYPIEVLEPKFKELKGLAHKNGMKFYSGENRLRSMGDNLCCCGIDGMPGFRGNNYNINNILNGHVEKPTPAMEKTGTGEVFVGFYQKSGARKLLKTVSFKDMMLSELKNKTQYYKDVLGKE